MVDDSELWESYKQDPSDENRNRIVMAYEHIARLSAKKFKNKASSLYDADDYYSIGMICLIGCVRTFDTSRGVPFAAYCSRAIAGEFAIANRLASGLSVVTKRRVAQILDAKNKIGGDPTIEELAKATGMPEDLVKQYSLIALAVRCPVESIDADRGDGFCLRHELCEQDKSPESYIDQMDTLRAAIKKLNVIDREIIKMRFWEGADRKAIAKKVNLHFNTVSVRLMAAVKRLQSTMKRNYKTPTWLTHKIDRDELAWYAKKGRLNFSNNMRQLRESTGYPDLPALHGKILVELKSGPMSTDQIAEKLNASVSYCRNALAKLKRGGYIERRSGGGLGGPAVYAIKNMESLGCNDG